MLKTLKTDVNTKLEALKTSYNQLMQVSEDITSIQMEHDAKLSALKEQLGAAEEVLITSDTMTLARKNKANVDSIKQDIDLQQTVSEITIAKKVAEAEALIDDCLAKHTELSHAYKPLDNEITALLNIRNYDEYKELMQSISDEDSDILGDLTRLLLRYGYIKQGVALYKGVHLSAGPLISYSKFSDLAHVLAPHKGNMNHLGIK